MLPRKPHAAPDLSQPPGEQKAFLVPILDSPVSRAGAGQCPRECEWSKYLALRDNLNNLQLQRDRERRVTLILWSSLSLTLDGQQGLVDLPGQERLGQLPEELLEDGGHVVNAHLVSQDHVNPAVEVFPELKQEDE